MAGDGLCCTSRGTSGADGRRFLIAALQRLISLVHPRRARPLSRSSQTRSPGTAPRPSRFPACGRMAATGRGRRRMRPQLRPGPADLCLIRASGQGQLLDARGARGRESVRCPGLLSLPTPVCCCGSPRACADMHGMSSSSEHRFRAFRKYPQEIERTFT
jgi:hypothetical protein